MQKRTVAKTGQSRRECEGGEPSTGSECMVGNTCHRVGECKGGEPSFSECLIVNTSHTVRECEGGEVTTEHERRVFNRGQCVWKRNRAEERAVVERFGSDFFHPRRDNGIYKTAMCGDDSSVTNSKCRL